VIGHYRVASLTLLLDNGIPVHQTAMPQIVSRGPGYPMLFWSCFGNYQERSVPLARLLLERGADTEQQDDRLRTALHAAAFRDNSPIANLLLEHGANVNATDEHGRTPLHVAKVLEDDPMVKLLLEYGANVNAPDNDGETPLHCACLKDDPLVANILLESGADVNATPTKSCVSSIWSQLTPKRQLG
jgi:ankyrin repeat protein